MRIALLTDFGTRDPYVAAMKGVIASRTDAPVHDLTHEIAAFDVREAAWFLRSVVRYWPEGTIFVCVVDPGVGTARRIVAVEREGRVFLAPDNGLLTFVADHPSSAFGTFSPRARGEKAASAAYVVENTSLFLAGGSNTFHGRDRFAPVAAAVANGMSLAELGPRVDDLLLLDDEAGAVVAIDRFGNVITDIDAARLPLAIEIGGRVIERLETSYADAAAGLFLIVGSSGTVEISIANASAADELGVRRGESVTSRPL
jgi:S-adenosylmethionine hydrolase